MSPSRQGEEVEEQEEEVDGVEEGGGGDKGRWRSGLHIWTGQKKSIAAASISSLQSSILRLVTL